MAKQDSKRTRKFKDIARGITRAHDTASKAKKVVTNPPGYAMDKAFQHIRKYGDSPRRRGPIRDRTQHYNSRTQRFIKRDTKTGKIIGSKKRTPYKNVRLE